VAIQGLGDWLIVPMKFFSFLGVEEFYLVALPFLYRCVDSGLGLRVGVMMLFSSGLNPILKIPFHGPRPYWVSTVIKPLWAETSFGMPSGHAQQAVAVWGFTAGSLRRTWAWVSAGAPLLFGRIRLS
jgi:membrane-associated phospholipid phosphatase